MLKNIALAFLQQSIILLKNKFSSFKSNKIIQIRLLLTFIDK